MDIGAVLNIKHSWRKFCTNHPKFPGFLHEMKSRGFTEGTEIKITVTYPDGQTLNSGLNLKESDLELLNTVTSVLR